MGVSVKESFFMDEIAVAEGSLSKKAEFLTKYCNIKQNSSIAWLEYQTVENAGVEKTLEDFANALTAYAKTADVTKAINAAVAGLIQLDDLSVASTGAGNVVTGLAYDNKTGKFTVTKGLTALTEADFTEITQQEVKAMFA